MPKAIKPKDSKTLKEKQKAEKKAITRQSVIGSILEGNPSRATKLSETMLSYGLHCVGCHANVFDTVENGCRLHGMAEETIDKLVKDLNAVIAEDVSVRKGIALTEAATSKIKELLQKEKKENYFLRISVKEGGCAGHTYDMSFDNKQQASDISVEDKGVKMAMDAESRKFMEGAVIDYVDSLQGSGFKVDNPNVTRSCKCGESFG